jgi:hypothetical protein
MRILVGLLIFFVAFQVEAKNLTVVEYKQIRFTNACVGAANIISSYFKGGIPLQYMGASEKLCEKQADAIPTTEWKTMMHTSERGCLTAFAKLMPKNLPQDKVAKVADDSCRGAVSVDQRLYNEDIQLMAKDK